MSGAAYRWKPGSRVKINAKVAGAELERLRTLRNGRLTPGDVLDAAKAKSSPLHKAFEWDDSEAAQKYRLEQASYLIRSIEIVVVAAKGKPQSTNVRAFVNVRRDHDRSYTSIGHAMSDTDLREQIVAQAWKELQDWRARYEKLSEFSKVFEAIDQSMPKEPPSEKAA
jgi:hypothetical protein